MEPSRLSEPFKATKLWNMIIQGFRTGMPLKRHRRGLRGRHHDNCFTSTEAIDWLHDYLQNCDRFGPWVTRAQTVSLLEKFLHSKVIQGVKGSTKGSPVKFEDNGDLYRFIHVSPIKKLRSALSSRSNLQSARTPLKTINSKPVGKALSYDNPAFSIQDADKEERVQVEGAGRVLPDCRLVQRTLTPAQREEVWKSATLNRLQRLLWLTTLDYLLDTSLVNPRHIIHNCTHVSRNGVVLVPKDQDDLPHWVLSAMKCLANWPNSPDSGLPNYPGFERDVFKTVSNYFLSLPQPLMTHHLYNLIIESFVTAERRDRGLYPGAESVSTQPLETIPGLTSFQSVENLMLNMTSGGVFGCSPELAGAPGRQIKEVADGKGRGLDSAASKRLKMMDRRRWNGDVRGIPPNSDASHFRAEMGSRWGSAGDNNRAFGIPHSPPAQRGQKGVQRSSSISVTGFTRPGMDGGHQQPLVGDGRCLQAQPQAMRRCVSELTTGHHGSSQNNPSRAVRECQPRPALSRAGYGWQSDQEPARESCEMRHPQLQPQPRQRPDSVPVKQRTPKFPSASNLHAPGQQQQDCSGLVNGSRKFTSQIIISKKDGATSSTMHIPQSRLSSSQQLTSGSSKDLNYGFPMQYPDPSTNNRRGFGSMNDLGNANPKDCPQKESNIRNLFVSKKFGSASELIHKIFKKKSSGGEADSQGHLHHSISLGHHLRGSTPNIPLQEVQQHSNPLQNPDKTTPPNSVADYNVKIRPSYPLPLRATLSYSDIGSSRENSTCHTPESYPQVDRLCSVSSSDVRLSVGVESSEGTQKLKRSDSTASLYLSEEKSYTDEAMRLCCLLLPPVNRRKLHLLMKLTTRMNNNHRLVLSSRKTTRQLVLQTFSRAVLCSEEEIDYNEALSSRIVEYLMDNNGNVFSQPEDLKADVEDRLVYLPQGQIKYMAGSENQKPAAPSYCQKLSIAEYEAQKLSHSQQAIADLLEVIIRDHNMPSKDKKKKLKQFQKTYPGIYARRLPTTASEAELFPEKPKIKQPMTNVRKSLTKLKSLR